jgi:cytoskeletal protein RodZ
MDDPKYKMVEHGKKEKRKKKKKKKEKEKKQSSSLLYYFWSVEIKLVSWSHHVQFCRFTYLMV